MRPQIVFGTLLAGTAAASSNIPGVLRGAEIIQKRQTGPVSPDTASDCTYWDTALEGFNTCVDFQSAWEITFDNFFDYVSFPRPLLEESLTRLRRIPQSKMIAQES